MKIKINSFTSSFIVPTFYFSLRFPERVRDDGGDDDRAAPEGPARRALAEDEEDPDGIQHGFDVADDARVQATHTARDAEREERVGDADLYDAEIGDDGEVVRVELPRARGEGWERDEEE